MCCYIIRAHRSITDEKFHSINKKENTETESEQPVYKAYNNKKILCVCFRLLYEYMYIGYMYMNVSMYVCMYVYIYMIR